MQRWPLILLTLLLLGLGACQIVIFADLEQQWSQPTSAELCPFPPSPQKSAALEEATKVACEGPSPSRPPWLIERASPPAVVPELVLEVGPRHDPGSEVWLGDCLSTAFARH